MSRLSSNAGVLGVALTPVSVTAASAGTPTVWQRDLALQGGANGSLDLLTAAFVDATRAAALVGPSIVVALLPPLAETRAIALPPLAADDRNRFLARNAARYFVGARGPQVVGSVVTVAPHAEVGTDSATIVLTSSTTQLLMQTLDAAASAAGGTLQAVVPAESAWAAAAVALWPVFARGTAYAVITRADRTDLLTMVNGALQGVRRFRGPADAPQIAAIASGGGDHGSARVAVAGPSNAAHAMIGALTATGLRVLAPEPKWAALAAQPDALAARFAADAEGLTFRTDASIVNQRAAARRTAWWAFAAGSVALIVAGFVHYAGVRRELAQVQAGRAAIRQAVDATIAGRAPVDAAYRQVAALASAARDARRWSAVFAALAANLPLDASLTAVRVRGDSLFIDGVAEQAAPVFDAIARMPGVISVRATAPVRRDAIEGEAPLEHFSLGAQLSGGKR